MAIEVKELLADADLELPSLSEYNQTISTLVKIEEIR